MSGDKAVREIGSSIDGMVKESFEKGSAIKKRMETRGIYLGFEEIVDILDKNVEKSDEVAKLIVNELDKIYEVIEAKSKELANLPGENIQAMMIGISRALTYAITGEKDVLDDNTIELLARCAIDSDRTIGYGIPLYDVKKPKDGNIFCVILQTLKDAKDEAGLKVSGYEISYKAKRDADKTPAGDFIPTGNTPKTEPKKKSTKTEPKKKSTKVEKEVKASE